MLLERIDELSLERHDFGGSANALLGRASSAGSTGSRRTWSGPRTTRAGRERLDRVRGGGRARVRRGLPRARADAGRGGRPRRRRPDPRCAARGARAAGDGWQRFEHVLVDDAQELDLASATLSRAVAGVAADGRRRPVAGGRERDAAMSSAHVIDARAEPAAARARLLRAASAAARVLVRADGGGRARSRSGAAPTSAPRRSRSPPTSSG